MAKPSKGSDILAVAILVIFVAVCLLLTRCPAKVTEAPTVLPVPAAAATCDSTQSKPNKRAKKKAQEPKPLRIPQSRKYLDEAVSDSI